MELIKDRTYSIKNHNESHYTLYTEKEIEVEYLIVDKNSLKTLAVSDKVLQNASGNSCSIYYPGGAGSCISWRSTKSLKTIKFKVENTKITFKETEKILFKQVEEAGKILEAFDAVLLPSSIPPIQEVNDKAVFNYSDLRDEKIINFNIKERNTDTRIHCMRLNLHFSNELEFFRLHTAIRLILPLIPAISSATPIFENSATGFLDSAVEIYKSQESSQIIPDSLVKVIGSTIKSKENNIHCLPNEILSADFDRGILSLGIFNMQESPLVDLAIARFITYVLEILINNTCKADKQASVDSLDLSLLLDDVLRCGMNAVVHNKTYLEMLDIRDQDKMSVWGIWMLFAKRVRDYAGVRVPQLDNILKAGSLAERILKSIEKTSVLDTYRKIAECLRENRMMLL